MKTTNVAALLLSGCLLVGWVLPVHGQGIVPTGDQVQLNVYTTATQWRPAVAAMNDGRFIVAWESDGSYGDDVSGASIQARCFDADGTSPGSEVQVNTYSDDNQRDATVATLGDGSLAFAWMSFGSHGSDSSSASIQTRRFNPDCTPLGEEIQVNTYTTEIQSSPVVAALADGGFVIVWDSYGSHGSDSSSDSIQGRRFAADGAPMGGEFQVNSYTFSRQETPSVAALADGGFMVVWHSLASSGSDSNGFSIQGRRFGADGLPLAEDFQVNTYTPDVQVNPAVAALADGGFVVAWDSEGSSGSDSSRKSIQGQRYAADGTAVEEQFQLNSHTALDQLAPVLTGLPSGGFVAAWHSFGSSGSDSSSWSVQTRRFTSGGDPLGDDLQINSYTADSQLRPIVTTLAGGELAVVWVSEGSDGSDASGWSIQGRRLAAVPRHALVGLAGKCLDVEGAVADNGTSVIIYRCHGGDNQRWQIEPTHVLQQIKGLGGKCLIPDFDHPSGDLRVVIGDCGGPDDRWSLATPGSSKPSALIHFQTGLCLDVAGAVSADGTPVNLFDCHGGANQTWRPAPELCARDSQGLCLNRERFRVDLDWHSFDGSTGSGKAVPVSTDDSGLLWFFQADNWEMLIKVLDGCAINDRVWVFAAATTTVEYTVRVTDTALGTIREYHNPLGNAAAAITDTDAFDVCSAAGELSLPPVEKALPVRSFRAAPLPGDDAESLADGMNLKGVCFPSPTNHCLSLSRFRVEAEWRDFDGNVGSARAVPMESRDSGLFYFFDANNWEMLVKVLDACHLDNPSFLMLAAATTDVEYTLRVTDGVTGESREYFNPLGNDSAALVDTFETCP